MSNKRIIELTIARAKCRKCGFERILYFTSGFNYGERVVSTKDGKLCAYSNLLTENIIPELYKYCRALFQDMNITVTESELARIIPNLYGITCDPISGEKVDTFSYLKCNNCLDGIMEEDEAFGEKTKKLEAVYVTHNIWNQLDDIEKRDRVVKELRRLKYLF